MRCLAGHPFACSDLRNQPICFISASPLGIRSQQLKSTPVQAEELTRPHLGKGKCLGAPGVHTIVTPSSRPGQGLLPSRAHAQEAPRESIRATLHFKH